MKTALGLGRANQVFAEGEAAMKLGPIDYVLAGRAIAVDFERVDIWCWFHAELFPDFAERRAKKGFAPVKEYWTTTYHGRGRGPVKGMDIKSIEWNMGGSSGMVATFIALDKLHCGRVMLAGIPMTPEGGRYDDGKPWPEALVQRGAWITHLEHMLGRVRSFSGWTLETLEGKPPTTEWLRGRER